MKDQIDRMKRKKVLDDQWSSDEEGSLEQPTIKKGGSGMNTHNATLVSLLCTLYMYMFMDTLMCVL